MNKIRAIMLLAAIMVAVLAPAGQVCAEDGGNLVFKADLLPFGSGDVAVWAGGRVEYKVKNALPDEDYIAYMEFGPAPVRTTVILGDITTDEKGKAKAEFYLTDYDIPTPPSGEVPGPSFHARPTSGGPPPAPPVGPILSTGFEIP